MRRVAGLLLLGGCQVLFPLESGAPECPLPPVASCQVDDPDEDDDGLKDDCDPCPYLADDDEDSDADGIGDACDPAPDVAASCNVRRFFSLDTDQGWMTTAGWSFDGAARNASSTLAVLRSSEVRGTGRVETLLADNLPLSADSLIGVVLLAGEDSGLLCAIHPDPGGAVGQLVLAELTANGERVIEESSETFSRTPGKVHRLRLSIALDGRVICRSDGRGDQDTVFELDDEIESMETTPVAGSFGIAIRSLPDRFFYVDYVPD